MLTETNNVVNEKLEEILADKQNLEKIAHATKKSDVSEIFAQQGIDLTDEQFNEINKGFSKIRKKILALGPDTLKNVVGGKGKVLPSTKMGTGIGIISGMAIGTFAGTVYGIVDTVAKSKPEDSFIKNFWKVLGKTSAATLSSAVVGAAIGGGMGASVGLIGDADEELSKKQGE